MAAKIDPRMGEEISIDCAPSSLNRFRLSRKGKMTIFVCSKKVDVATKILSFPTFHGGYGSNLAYQAKRVVVYEYSLDQGQREVLANAEAFARSLGIKLEVKDVGRSGVFSRLADSILRRKIPSRTPSVSVSGEAVYLLAKMKPPNEKEERIEEANVESNRALRNV